MTTAGNTDLSRVISWTVRDGSTSNGTSTTDTSDLAVTSGPQIGAGGTVTYNAGDGPLALDASITLADGDIDDAGGRNGIDHQRFPERRHAGGRHHGYRHHGQLQQPRPAY